MPEAIHPVITGVIGAGAISDAYLSNLCGRFSDIITVKSVAARHAESAERKAAQYGLVARTTQELLDDPQIELVVILTPVGTHYELIRAALEAGKHVYTEKTIAVTSEEANELIDMAQQKGLYLGSAPDTFLGSCFETASKAIKDGMLGDINSFSVSICRNNDILTSMFGFLRQPGAGILRDYVVYYLTALVEMLGPVEQVAAYLKTPYPTRTCILPDSPEYGQTIATPNEAILASILRLRNGVVGTLHDDSETYALDRADFVIHGTKGMLFLGNPNNFGDPVRFLPAMPSDFAHPEEPIVLEPVNDLVGSCRGAGVADMARALRMGASHRASAEMARHVLCVIEALERSAETGTFQEV